MAFINDLLTGCPFPEEGQCVFISNDHIRFQNGVDVSGHNYGCNRTLIFQKNISGKDGYSVSIKINDACHPLWGDNYAMAPKQMKPIFVNNKIVKLQGFGCDIRGASFSDYAMSIHHNGSEILKCTLHMINRGVEIEYYSM